MSRCRLTSCRVLPFGLVALLAVGCMPHLQPQAVRVAPTPGSPRIVILKSNDNPVFDRAIQTFIRQSTAHIAVFSAADRSCIESLIEAIEQRQPDLLFVLGTRATLLAKRHFTSTPVLFAMVVNFERHHLAELPNFMGIALELPPAAEYAQFKMIAPRVKRVLAFYSPTESLALVNRARTDLLPMGVELVATAVETPEQLEARYEELAPTVDAVWLLNDPTIMSARTFSFLRDRTQAQRLPFFASLSDRFVEAGALASVSQDFAALGSQAVAMSRQLLEQGVAPSTLGVQAPIGSTLALSLDVAHRIGLEIAEDIMPYIDRLIAPDVTPNQR